MREDEYDNAFYEAIGRALTAWSGIEACLTSLFQVCFDTVIANEGSLSRSGFSGKVLDAVDGMNPRVKMVDEALAGVLSNLDLEEDDLELAKAALSQWVDLRKLIMSDLVPRRNKLAHWSVYVTWDSDLNLRKPILVPHQNSFKRHEILRDNKLDHDLAFIMECRTLFEDTHTKLNDLFLTVSKHGFGIIAQLDNMRAALHYWGASVDVLCDHLRRPYASEAADKEEL